MKLMFQYFLLIFVFLLSFQGGFSQTTNISGIINNYASVSSLGSQSVNVPSTTGFAVGDKVLLIQMKGAGIDTTNTSNFGTINSYNDAGNYEMLVISSISSTTITFTTPVLRTYNVSGLVQLVKVPVYNNANIIGVLTCLPWNGLTGGVLVFEATGNVTLNANVDVTGKGFLGGAKLAGQLGSCVGNTTGFKLPITSLLSTSKGEGITIIKPSFAKGLGALANGGGAGNDVNGGGAGGGNYGLGGHGGNTKCSSSPISLCGGREGKNCLYSNANNKIFLGGGGGAGHENDGVSTGGVAGGGIIIIRCGGAISGNGNAINANGNNNVLIAGNDGQGGGGAGGVILLEACSSTSLNISVTGGNGGTDNFSGPDCHGKGGGGGGGVIWTSTALSYTSFLNGGNPGVFTNAASQCFNTSNGATTGQAGGILTGLLIPGATPLSSIGSFSLTVSSACVSNNNSTATASVSTTATSPVFSYTWTNSSGTIISQTNNTSSLSNSVLNLANDIYTLTVQMNAPCGPINTQTLNINCVIAPSQSCGGSLEFNNISDAVSLPLNNQIHSSNGFTWECWFKLNTTFASNPRALINSIDAVSYEDIYLGFGWNYGAGNVPINHLGFKVDGPNATTGPTTVSCDYMPPGGFLLGTWYHAAGVMDYIAHTSKLYVNGLLVDTKIENADPFFRTIQSQLSYDPSLALGGNMDEVRIWNKVRTDSEIFADYNHCLVGNETNLLSYYRCNQTTGILLTDATSNGNNGTLINTTNWSTLEPTLSVSSCSSLGNFSMSITSTCVATNNATAIAAITTTITSPVVSYSWTNSSGTIISQTTNTTSLTNTVSNLPNGIYTLISQINAPCGPMSSQTITINCTPPPLCSGTLGAPVFFEDFGSGASLYGPALPPGVTNYTYLQGIPNNGTYVIASSSNPSGTNAGYVNDNQDHTGNTNGYMMVVNSDYPAAEVYRKHVTGLCPGTTYVFSAYLANNNSPAAVSTVCGSSYVYANIKFFTEYPLGTVQGSVTSGNLAVASNSVNLPWIQYGFAFTTLPGQTTVDVVLQNNAPGGCGNDYVVDDISLAPCGPGVSLSIVPNQTLFCPGESLTLQSAFTSGGYTLPQYQWQFSSDGGITWTNISGATSPNYNIASVASSQAGMYQLLVSENGNINLSSCRIVAGPLTFSVAAGVSVTPTVAACPGITTTLTATGATSYVWTGGSTSNSITVNPSTTTVYTVTGTVGTCTSQAVSTVSVVTNSTLTASGNTLICSGQASTLTASGASSYSWTSSGNTLSSTTGSIVIATPTITTTYSVSSTSTLCSSPALITVSVSPTPTLTLSPNTSICLGATTSVTLTANGAATYSWANSGSLSSPTGSAVIASPNATTIYTVTGITASCSNTAAVTVSVNPSPTITAVSFSNTSCGLNNGSVIVTSLPANNTYTWSGGVISATNTAGSLAAGNYSVTAINGSCQTTTVVTILNSLPLLITSSTITASDCNLNNGSIVVTDNNINSNYSWSPNVSSTNTASNLPASNYALTISNGACSTSTIFVVPQLNGPTSLNVVQSDAICESMNGSINIVNTVNGTAPYQYNFNNTGFSSVNTYSNLAQGSYTITVKDAHDCFYTQAFSINKSMVNLTIDLMTNSPTCNDTDGSYVINNFTSGTPPYLTSFNNGAYSGNLMFDQLGIGTYSLTIRDSNMCETPYVLTMQENGEFTLYIPNTFTPNNNIVNDIWYVKGTCLNSFHCVIYNRWGEKIKELNDITEGWDGTCKGASVPDGVYVYLIEVETQSGTISKAGHITIFR